uniref:Serpentine Receptor, class H n=1 Tax=Bursaphelenchus xylophilus TaxID=6326 RepID=A0A1I7S4R1_BURXY
MGIYKHYLLNEIFWNYAFDLFLCIWTPIELFPLQCSYSAGIFRRTSVGFQQFAVIAASFFAVGKVFALFIAIAYRYSQALPPSSHYILRTLVQPNIYLYVIVFLTFQFAINAPMFLNFNNLAAVKLNLTFANRALEYVYNTEPSTLCFGATKGNTAALFYVVMGVIGLLFICSVSFMLTHLWELMRDGSSMSCATYRIQLMLFKSIRMQLFSTLIILGIPVIITLACVVFRLRKSPIYIMVAATVACLHSTFNCLILIYCVKPYRQFLTRKLGHHSKTDSRVISTIRAIGAARTV